MSIACAAFALFASWSLAPTVLASAPPPLALGAQEDGSDEERALQKKLDRYLELSKTGRIPVRPQAARRLVKLGAPAAERLLTECGADGAGLVDFGPYLVEVLADFDDSRLRARLWKALRKEAFPWRAPAARGLGGTARDGELEAFLELSWDPVAQVRRASVEGLGTFDGEGERVLPRLEQLALDPDEGVRRDAAAQLDALGKRTYLLWLVAELERTDTYFRMPLGEKARFESLRVLRERLGEDFGFKAEDSPESEANRVALTRLRAAALERAGVERVDLPPIAAPGQRTEGDMIGLELRSCRVGDLFLRWNADDILYVGTGTPLALKLEPGTVARLLAELPRAVVPLGEERYFGEAGCDIEQLRLVAPDGRIDVFLISKGQAAVPELRPAALDSVVERLLASIPASAGEGPGGDPRALGLRARVRQALLVLGGEFGP
jgi:hypothetical protein